MAEGVVTFQLERLATLALAKAGKELKLITGVEKQVKSLIRNLKAIQDVLEDAEQRQVEEASVRRWLAELSEVSNDMENVLDEWITRAGMRQMEKQEKHALTIGKKVCSSASSFFSGSMITRLIHNRDIAGRIREYNERLALIDKEKQAFSFQTTMRVSKPHALRETTSLPNVKTFGRDHEKTIIVSKLLSDDSQRNEVPLIIPIVGMGGMGKTSLVNLVYNDAKIKSHFDKRIWVCVSDPFEEIKISKAILEGLGRGNTSSVLETLMKKLNKSIQGKKFLLVLDDVWSPKLCQWEELIKPLRNGAMGSRVLVTTRNEEVATLMEATTQMIPLKGLGEAFCLSLFYYYAKIDEGSVPKEIQDIALDIVEKCNGLPLAAKTLGSLMRSKKKIQEWRAILTSKTWELKEIQQDVFRPLLLSYHDLTPATKRCLFYCAAFPKDYVFDKTSLIEMWMSQDYLHGEGNKGKMIVGQDHFDELVMRSFFQDVKVKECVLTQRKDISCKIHDIVHDFLQYLTKNDCLILDFELDADKKMEVSTDNVYHLTLLHAAVSDSFISCLPSCKRLRTLTLIDPSTDLLSSTFELILELKCLRTLNLSRQYSDWSKVSVMLGRLMHLRYLDLSYNIELRELPDTMGMLYNLQTFRLVSCVSLKKIDVGRLTNLRHLYVKHCCDLTLIKGIENLQDLQTLDEFRVGTGDDENKLEHLKDLNQVQVGILDIRTTGKPNVEEKGIMLSKQVHLSHLRLEFGRRKGDDREIMDNLEPHPDLESLNIYGYKSFVFSHWLSSLHGLRVLNLSRCRHMVLPPLGKLASLESLRIEHVQEVDKVGVEFLSSNVVSFPKLQNLEFRFMGYWEVWEGAENITIMPCLSELAISNCNNLRALPDFLWKTPLQKLEIRGKGILRNLYKEEIGEDWAKISHIPNLNIQEY